MRAFGCMCWFFVFAGCSSTVGGEPSNNIDDATLTFKAQVVFDDKDVDFFNFAGTDACNQGNDVLRSAQYADYKGLHAQLVQLLANNQDGNSAEPFRAAQGLAAARTQEQEGLQGVVDGPAQRHHSPRPQDGVLKAFLRRHKASR
ncbi:hypothetical protein PF011_g11056 [Phytophthora fragariae]|uniref:RxLR effector protein n=1 Tax=Phytophthora fragariae TaxID=53985 RepID=A0A6A3KPL1_9STRA|nr:hypothetical protein PF011_g11056 [Phytophthora fragariae]